MGTRKRSSAKQSRAKSASKPRARTATKSPTRSSATKGAPKSVYAGYFCFQNQLGQTIDTGWCKHWTSDYGTDGPIMLDGLAHGDTSQVITLKTSTTNRDHWMFWVKLTDGNIYSVGDHACGFESDDSGKTVILQPCIAGSDRTFNIIMPESSSCNCSF